MDFSVQTLKKSGARVGIDTLVGTGAAIANLHAGKIIPEKYVGMTLLGAGLIGNFFGGDIPAVRTASVITIAMGAIKVCNQLGKDNGLPSDQGYKGVINKIVPSLGAVDEAMLGETQINPQDLLGLNDVIDVEHREVPAPQLQGLKLEQVL